LPIFPITHRPGDIDLLRAFVPAAEQQHHLRACEPVIDSVARSGIHTELPYTVSAISMIPEVAQFYPTDAVDDGDPGLGVSLAA